MHCSPAIGRAQPPGSFVGHTGTDAVAKKTEWHGHQWLERMIQPLHQRAHSGQWCLVKARCTARQLHGAEIDRGRHKASQRPVKRGIPRSVGKAEKTAANDIAFISKWHPPIEGHSSHRAQRAVKSRTGPEIMRNTSSLSMVPFRDLELRRPAAHDTAFARMNGGDTCPHSRQLWSRRAMAGKRSTSPISTRPI